jgi:predicted nucleotidyltransferase
MRIDPKGAIAGYPAVLVRDTLRRLRVHLDWNLARLESVAGFSVTESRAFVRAMISAGLIERAGSGRWSVTRSGQTMSSATAAARVTRATGDRALQEFMARVDRVNQDRNYLGKVIAVVLFGSMLKPEVDRPSDVDIAVEIAPREADPERAREKNERRAQELEAKGHRFRGLLDRQVCWYREAFAHLKGRSRVISLVDLRCEGEIVWAAPHQILYSQIGWKPYIPPPPPVVRPAPPVDDCPF